MSLLESWVKTPVADALGWTLVHSLWEGAIIAAAFGLLLSTVRSPRVRYFAGCAALVAMLLSFAITLWRLWPETVGLRTPVRFKLPLTSPLSPLSSGPAHLSFGELLSLIAPWLAPLWIAGVFLFSVHSAIGWFRLCGLRHRGVCAAPSSWQVELNHLAAEFRVSKPVLLLESVLADTPMVLGHLRPVVLVPLGFLSGLPPEQVEAILLHELAHIRRADYLLNTLQRLIEGLLFYHPAVWFISRVIRTERENCCDDAVVTLLGNPHAYAEALAALERNRVEQGWQRREPAMAATGGSLINRVQRLLYPKSPNGLYAPAAAAAAVIATTAMALFAWQANASAMAQPPDNWSKWLNEDVVYIIEPQEKTAFESLTTDDERQHFVEQFWERRNPTPGLTPNAFKQEHYRRIAYANTHWAMSKPGWQTDRGRIYIQYGPPDEIDSHPSGDSQHTSAYEMWGYGRFKGFIDTAKQTYVEGDDVYFTFVYRLKDYSLEGAQRMIVDRASNSNLTLAETPATSRALIPLTWQMWLNEDVVYIIDPREKAAFESLQTDPEREHFVEQFWERRNPTPGSSTNAFKEEHYRRIAYANTHWAGAKPGWQTARGRIYIQYGPPDEIESHPKGDDSVGFPHEEWLYRHIVGPDPKLPDPKSSYGPATFSFVDRARTGDFELDKAMLPAAPPK